MNKEIIIVYQDCFMCGARKNWGEHTISEAYKAGVPVRKVSFASVEGQSHCMNAIKNGIVTFPFVTDGKTYATSVEKLLEAESKPQTAKKTARKTKKTQKGAEDGAISNA